MKKKLVTMLAVCVALVLTFSLAACNDTPNPEPGPTATPEETLKEGYFSYSYSAGSYGSMDRFMHFYDDIVYYGQKGGGGEQGYVYDYTIEKTSFEYSVWYTREERYPGDNMDPLEKHTGTAEYTITVTDRADSKKTYTLGYDGSYIYAGDATKSGFIIGDSQEMRYTHDAKNENKFSEINTILVKLEKTGDATSFIEINHNGTYSDMISTIIEGKYTKAKGADGKVTYTLTPNDSTQTGVTLVVAADEKSGTYTPNGGTAVELVAHVEKTVAITLTGETTMPAMNNLKVVYELEMYDDSTCTLFATVGGNKTQVDTGTYTVNQAYQFVYTFATLGELTGKMQVNSPTDIVYGLDIPAGAVQGAEAATISNGTLAPQPLFVFEGSAYSGVVTAKLTLFDDGTCSYELKQNGSAAGDPQTGTYTKNSYQIPDKLTIGGKEIIIKWDTATGVLSANMAEVSNNVAITVTFTLPTQA